MTDEIWRGSVQFGKEVTAGTAVAATRKMYFRDPVFTKSREQRPHRASLGRRDNVFKRTLGPRLVGGNLVQAMSATEILELLLISLKGAVAPTQPAVGPSPTVYDWTFKPSPTLDSATAEWHDGSRVHQVAGVRGNSLNIAGDVDGENLVTVEAFGMSMADGALTGALADRRPKFHEGWETQVYIDPFGATPGTTVYPVAMRSWDITLNNGLQRQYFADNTLNAGAITSSELEIDATVVFRASPALVKTEFDNFESQLERIVTLRFGNNEIVEDAFKYYVEVAIPGIWTGVDLGGNQNGMRTYSMGFSFVYEDVLAAGIQIVARNNRATAF
jgi:hypothetical protein